MQAKQKKRKAKMMIFLAVSRKILIFAGKRTDLWQITCNHRTD